MIVAGVDDEWRVPVAVFSAAGGFDDSAWLDALPVSTIAYRIAGAQIFCATKACGGRGSAPGRNVAFQPAGSSNASRAGEAVRFAHILVSDQILRFVGESVGYDFSGSLRDDLWFVPDDQLEALTSTYVMRSLDRRLPPTRLEMEARSLLLIEHLASRHHKNQTAGYVGGLAPWQQRQVEAFVREHFAQDLPLDALARIAGISTFHFARAFKKSTGLAPHAYLRRLRCERACELLLEGVLSVGDISAHVGYETPQAFARMFRAETGVSPTGYRRERRL